MLEKGLVQVYTSANEDINYAPIGLALRAVGHNFKVLIACFIKHPWMEGEMIASRFLKPHLTIEHAFKENSPKLDAINNLFKQTRSAIIEREYDMVILNGINELCHKGIIPTEEVLQLIKKRPPNLELILSGKMADERIIELADLVTDMHISKRDDKSKDEHESGRAPVQVITGPGKGKTTYCLGKSLLMSLTGIKSVILQFIKSPRAYGEVMAIERLPFLDIKTMGEGFIFPSHGWIQQKHRDAAKKAWEEGLKEVFSLKYGLIVLDEINIATYYGLVHGERVREMTFLKPDNLHLILSGRGAHLEVMEGADSVIEMREIKHPYKRGITARKGIEY